MSALSRVQLGIRLKSPRKWCGGQCARPCSGLRLAGICRHSLHAHLFGKGKAVEVFGKTDVLVNNVGTAVPKPFEETTLEEIDRVININLRSVFVVTQAVLKRMNNNGRIIIIGSCVGERNLTPGLTAYAATKGAVKMFTQSLSREVGNRGITVNNVQLGPIDTRLNPADGDWAKPQKAVTALDRYGDVDEVAALVAFVPGPESSYITGANLTVDGGTNA
jgi:3-oxoacyl-[acyl-carrier protein] reductase